MLKFQAPVFGLMLLAPLPLSVVDRAHGTMDNHSSKGTAASGAPLAARCTPGSSAAVVVVSHLTLYTATSSNAFLLRHRTFRKVGRISENRKNSKNESKMAARKINNEVDGLTVTERPSVCVLNCAAA
jgi:hypothetical protein